jgi:hypothetical protein
MKKGIGWIVDELFRFSHICLRILLFLLKNQARQLKDYENAVIAKRLEELDEDEIQALLEEVEKDNF